MLFPESVNAGPNTEDFYLAEIEGIIDPAISSYIEKCITRAQQDGRALIIQMDTPGGLETSMRDIIKAMLASPVPIIVYVAPQGARAASAGVFITYAADIAAMHPSTHIGAAHPVSMGISQPDEESMKKITNDSVAFIQNLAESRGRNSQWAAKAVTESDSITANQALELKVIDFTAASLDELMEKMDNMQVEKQGQNYILKTSNARIEPLESSLVNRFLHIIANPNIAYILFLLGMLGIIYEFSQPGLGISGALGVLFLLLGLYAFSILPVNYAGLGIIVLGVILFIVDIEAGTGGILSVFGAVSLILGSLLVIDSPAPYLNIAKPLIIGASSLISVMAVIAIRALYMSRRIKPATGSLSMVGRQATVVSDLSPEGQVKIDGEIWRAVSEEGNIEKGRKVIIARTRGLTLYVKQINQGG
ncbi:MAG: nodulation protein NfeD [Actinomycetota bacterium]|nr:nodulation protein NfeD [Actinomycetota bacterium]